MTVPGPLEQRLLLGALRYAQQGWHVFPCLSNQKQPATSLGHNDATTDPAQIRSWWTTNPLFNIDVATGPSGLIVIDVDDDDVYHTLRDRGFPLMATLSVVTPRGGIHYYYQAPTLPVSSRVGGLPNVGKLPGVDVRAVAGYVLAPPSLVGEFEYERVPGTPHMAQPLPTWLMPPPPLISRGRTHRRRKRGAAPKRLEGLVEKVAEATEGSRNDILNWAAYQGRALADQLDHSQVERSLLEAAVAAGLPEREARRTVRSGLGL